MLLNAVLVNALLAMTSVSALPSPNIKHSKLAVRGDDYDDGYDDGYRVKLRVRDDDDYDDYYKSDKKKLKARIVPNCGIGAYFGNGRCLCRTVGWIYDPVFRGCHFDCGPSAFWRGNNCFCRQRGFRWDMRSRRCIRG
ncbi:hypothetical protein CEP51_003660 [Fusarium floridanum]|uniref:Uncharacterized protein n=1 Tax=Fusarium floridanum TaxID=1325733 RepID=A0A428S4Z7_9HYPO|nr:hypothetical protein CEP51_003660 [Fusarium floridanum]